MAAEVMDGETVRRRCRLSVDALGQTRAAIGALNVFRVPDADTGTSVE
jgi:dihydroxyacetone kinase-like predicted kinase